MGINVVVEHKQAGNALGFRNKVLSLVDCRHPGAKREVISQGEAWGADLPAPADSAPGFRRPVAVVQGDALNRSRMATIVCVALTSNLTWALTPRDRDIGLFMRDREVLQQELICNDLSVGTFPPLGLVIQPELFSFSAQGVAVNPQSLGCL